MTDNTFDENEACALLWLLDKAPTSRTDEGLRYAAHRAVTKALGVSWIGTSRTYLCEKMWAILGGRLWIAHEGKRVVVGPTGVFARKAGPIAIIGRSDFPDNVWVVSAWQESNEYTERLPVGETPATWAEKDDE